MLKQYKIITLAPTCFGSRRNQHQGAILCLATTTKFVISLFHRAFFNSIMDETPTHALFTQLNAGINHRDFKFSVLNLKILKIF